MPHVPKWRRLLRFWRPDVAADVDDELRFHFEARVDDLRARGASPDDARRTAEEEFGDVEATRRRLVEIGERVERRRERAWWWRQAGADLRYALRGLGATPLFTAGVVLTLAVGIGAAASMYGTMRRLLIQPPPHVAAPERVAKLHFRYESAGDTALTYDRSSYPFWERLRAESRALAAVATYAADVALPVGSGDDARMARATFVSAGFWRALGTRPALGRLIADDEAHPATGARVVVLGHAFWQRRFGGDPAAVGRTLQVRGQPYRVIGVAPRGFRGVELADTDVWLPLFAYGDGDRSMRDWHTFASSSNLALVARLRPGVTAAQAAAELTRQRVAFAEEQDGARLRRGAPARQREIRVSVALGAVTGALGYDARRIPEGTVAVWLVGVAFVLLAIACANVASLLLLRALRRRREIAVRLALGMPRRRLAGLLLVESALVALLGGAASVVVAVWGGAWARRALLPRMVGESAGVDWRVVSLAAACVVATAILTGLAPALQTRRVSAAALKDGAAHGATRRSTLYWGLLVAQTALSAVLLVGAGLFLRSLHRVTTRDLGIDTERVLAVGVDFSGTGRPGRDVIAFHERALERVRAVPGVEGASLAVTAPFRMNRGGNIRLPGRADPVSTDRGSPTVNYVTPGFFATTGTRLLAGRDFAPTERGAPLVVVNEALARVAWPGRSPLGECVHVSGTKGCATVVGVVENVRDPWRGETTERLRFYRPLAPDDVDERQLLVRLAPGARGMEGTIRRALQSLEPGLPYVDVATVGAALDPQLRPWRLGAAVFTAFGALAALLAALGLYTAVAYAVAQRRREIGVRVAVGAAAADVVRLVLGDGVRVAAAGVAVGLLLALVAGRWIAALLFDTSPRDPVVLGAVAAALLLVAAAASLAPARRATRVSPTEALRAD